MSDTIRRQKARSWWALLFIFLFASLSVAAHVRIDATLIDDAYITYRYAANLARGQGLVYNPGDWILGTSTPAYALLLGATARITGPASIPVTSRVLNAVFLLIAGAAAGAVAKRLTGELLVGVVTFGMVTLGPATLFSSVAGMETPLLLTLLGLGTLALLKHRFWIAASVIGLTPLVRPEGAFVVGVVGITLLILHLRLPPGVRPSPRDLFLSGTLLLLPALIWFFLSIEYYGSPIPHSITAKQAGVYPVGIASTLGIVADYLTGSSLLVGTLSNRGHLAVVDAYTFLLLLSLVLTIFAAGGSWLMKRDPSLLVLFALFVLFVLFYSFSGTLLFSHYYANFEILAKACWWAGLYAISSWVLRRWIGQPHRALLVALGTGTALFTLLPGLLHYPWNTIWQGQLDTNEIDPSVQRQAAYHALATQVAPHLPNNTVVLLPEIGELGFILNRVVVLDACGLVSAEAVPYLPVAADQRATPVTGAIPPDLVRDFRPDLIITLEVFGRKGILDAAWFWSEYTPVLVRRGDWLPWDSTALYVFSRNDFEPGLALRSVFAPGP